ncbi:MAG: type I-B CRISPR-associated protein Cas7/Csh2 [Candidatus Altiarchaeales archaeon HGW-Altiarchaeales-3]|nr:MAG: type I-B CRISPR-associated protein Cas7/Csh2 [Candidatus Altiarchaeales archaeon HGW-Altiarchaeales-3]
MTTNKIIKNRSEIVFLYDIKDANPNGDPLDENKPRIDEETGINIVTDVRLKRTIRDYLMDFKGEEIFVREICYDEKEGFIQDGKMRAKNKDEDPEKILKECIDVRLFGGVIPLEKASITFTGPVQFRMGRSLHKVEMKHIKGTGAFASKSKSKQATFREEDILPYSLISFYGIINENAAKHTNLTEGDVNLLLEGMWDGTKNLISRSKAGQMPRLLLKVNYKEDNYHIGDLDKMIKLVSEKNDEQIRDISDISLDASELISTLNKYKDKIKSIDLKVDDRVNIDISGLDNEIEIQKNEK